MPVVGAALLFFEDIAWGGVAHLVEAGGVWIVRLNRDDCDAVVLVIFGDLFDASFVELGGRAVITNKRDHQNFGGGVVLQAMGLAVHAGKAEIGRLRSDGKRGWAVAFILVLGDHQRREQREQH